MYSYTLEDIEHFNKSCDSCVGVLFSMEPRKAIKLKETGIIRKKLTLSRFEKNRLYKRLNGYFAF